MIIEKARVYNLKAHSLIDRNTNDFIEDNLNAVKLRKLAKKSEKIHDLSRERNLIEEKRLDFLKQLMKKRQDHVETKWNMDYLKVRKALNELNERTVSKNSRNVESGLTASRLSSTGIPQVASTLSLFTANSIMIQSSTTVSNQTTTAAQNSASARSFMTSTQISKIFTNKTGPSESPCKYNYDNCFSRSHAMSLVDEQQEQQPFTSPSRCSLFPCSPLRSYTSILGEKNDRRVKTAPPRLEATSRIGTFKSPSPESEVEIECSAKTEQELSMQQVEHFNNNVSIRRPLRKTHSLRDFQFKINALEEQAKFCKEQNYANFKPSDRNIRYGEPLERKKIYRQLKLVAEFDRALA